MINALTIDVEDWFHILDIDNGCKLEDYDKLESRVEENCNTLLLILNDKFLPLKPLLVLLTVPVLIRPWL